MLMTQRNLKATRTRCREKYAVTKWEYNIVRDICSTITGLLVGLGFVLYSLEEKRSVISSYARTPSKTSDMIFKPSSRFLRFSRVVLSSRILFVFVHAAEPRADRPFCRPPVCFSQKPACQLAKVATFSSREAKF